MRGLGTGKRDEARALWRKVVDTRLMAFFEFDMATYYLKHPAGLGNPDAPGAPPPVQALQP